MRHWFKLNGEDRTEGSSVKKVVTPAARREAVAHLKQRYEMSERRACSVIGADRSSVRYRHRRQDDAALRDVLRAAAETHRRFGYRRLHVILRRDGHVLNRKRTQRLYREEGLAVRRRRSRKRAIGTRAPLVTEAVANARWSVDPRHGPRTMYGWLPRDKGVCDFRQLVGCGHVFGVSSAVCPRALMNVRMRLGSLSMARA